MSFILINSLPVTSRKLHSSLQLLTQIINLTVLFKTICLTIFYQVKHQAQ